MQMFLRYDEVGDEEPERAVVAMSYVEEKPVDMSLRK